MVYPAFLVASATSTEVKADHAICKVSVKRSPGTTASQVVVSLPDGVITGPQPNLLPSHSSNELKLTVLFSLGGGHLRTLDPAPAQSSPVTFLYSFPGHIWSTVDINKFASVGELVGASFSLDAAEVILAGDQGSTVSLQFLSNFAVDPVGHFNSQSEFVSRQIAGGGCSLGPWSQWGSCSDCQSFGPPPMYEPSAGQVSVRTRPIIRPGSPCEHTIEERPCSGSSGGSTGLLCHNGARPRSGESFYECASRDLIDPDKCIPSYPRTSNPGEVYEKSNCACDQACVDRGDCCMAFYNNNCCTGSNCQVPYVPADGNPMWTAFCDRAECGSSDPVIKYPDFPSYYCYCDDSCLADHTCCSGDEMYQVSCF